MDHKISSTHTYRDAHEFSVTITHPLRIERWRTVSRLGGCNITLGHLTSGLARVYMQDTVCTTAATLLQIRHCIKIKKIDLTLVLSPIRKNRITCMTKHHKDHEIFTHYSMGEAKRLDTHLVKTKLADGQFKLLSRSLLDNTFQLKFSNISVLGQNLGYRFKSVVKI